MSSIWCYETIFNLTKYLEKERPDFILNIWICGYKSESLDFIQVARILNEQTSKELIVPVFINIWNLKSISCSEKIVENPDLISEDFVDMESYWVEFIASKYKIPRLILKVPVDKIWSETREFDYNLALYKLKIGLDYKLIIWKIWDYFEKLSEEKDYSHIKNQFKLTFQEFEILKKKIWKYEAISLENFEIFFDKYKDLNKREFLEKIP